MYEKILPSVCSIPSDEINTLQFSWDLDEQFSLYKDFYVKKVHFGENPIKDNQ